MIYLTCLHCLREMRIEANDTDDVVDAFIDRFTALHSGHAKADEIAVSLHEPWWVGAVRATTRVKH